jgi:outer membrane biosynthesis protein TonB
MAKRRSLAEGLKSTPPANPVKEAAFVSGATKPKNSPEKKSAKPKSKPALQEPASTSAPDVAPEPAPEQILGRSPLTTRLRSDIGTALKRASLERQLAGQSPHTVQDILELILEPWLKNHGYLK